MNIEQLMKFRLRQMEQESNSTLIKKNTLQKLMGTLYKTIVVGSRSNIIVKGKNR